jgi:hypothetical protein
VIYELILGWSAFAGLMVIALAVVYRKEIALSFITTTQELFGWFKEEDDA